MITPSKNGFQKKYFNITPQNCSFKKCISNCYKLSVENKNATYVNYSNFKK